MTMTASRYLCDSIVYLCSLLADRPRPIDQYIDYFGETHPSTSRRRRNG